MTGAPFEPLRGVRIVDASRLVAGPFASQLLRGLGAAVDRVEVPGRDPAGALGDPHDATSLGRCIDDYCNDGKHRVPTAAADYAATIEGLCLAADLLVCDWTPGEQASLGLRIEALARRHPQLVIVAVTGHGLTGPRADHLASEASVYHAGGEGATLPPRGVDEPDDGRAPTRGGRFLADYDTGLTAAAAGLAALFAARRRGRGEIVDVAGVEVELGLNRTTIARALADGEDYGRGYRGYDYAGTLRCRDGWICLRPTQDEPWWRFVELLGLPELATDPRYATRYERFVHAAELTALLERHVADRSVADVRQVLNTAGCPGGPFLSPADILGDPAIVSGGIIAGHPRGGSAPMGFVRTSSPGAGASAPAARPRRPPRAGALPLAGVRVLDLTWVAAGPYAGELLAFLGADVIKVESRLAIDLFRTAADGSTDDVDSSIRFGSLNQGKRSLRLNLKHPEGRALLLELVEGSEILLENFRPGVRDRLGLSDDELHARNPGLTVVSLTGFGGANLDGARPGYASVFNAESGLGWMTGYADRPPADIRDSNDLRAGTAAAFAALAGLSAAAGSGRGPALEVAARDVLIALQGDAVVAASRGAAPARSGNALAEAVPYGVYRSRDDRWIAIGVRSDPEWAALSAELRDPGLAVPADASLRVRLQHRKELDAAVARWCAGRDAAEALAGLGAAGVPAGLSAVASDIAADPQLIARDVLRPVQHPGLGAVRLVGAPFRFASAARAEAVPPPRFGEHTAEILAGIGIGPDRLAELTAAGVID